MGLLDKLQNDGSTLSVNNGQTVTPNPLSTDQSKMHGTLDGNPGYSLVETKPTGLEDVPLFYKQYDDGVVNPLPFPSRLDLNGIIPKSSGHNNDSYNASSQPLPYTNINNIPK